jgi:hypothetical protein
MKHYEVSQALFQALLDHYWRAKQDNVPQTAAQYPKGYCISYGHLIKAAKVPLNPRDAGGPLFEIASFCWETYGVPLHALVVNGSTGSPGGELDGMERGFFGAPGSSKTLSEWETVDVPKCIAANFLPKIAPPLPIGT